MPEYTPKPPPVEIRDPEVPMAVAVKGITQITYDQYRNPIIHNPNSISFVRGKQWDADIFEAIPSIITRVNGYQKIYIQRTYALGDIIMVIPVLNYLSAKFPTKSICLLTPPEHHQLFSCETRFSVKTMHKGGTYSCSSGELSINADNNTFECDHCKSHPFNILHRTDILYQLMGVPEAERTYDYSIGLSNSVVRSVSDRLSHWKLEPKGFCYYSWRGSNPIKTFPVHIRKHHIETLARHIPVVVGDFERNPQGWFEHPNVHWLCGESALPVTVMVGMAKFVVTTDSGSLWFSHLTECPTVCFLGPTEEATRLGRHPLYPDLCRKIELKDLVGCPETCHHMLDYCGGHISCFHETDPQKTSDRMMSTLQEMKLL